MNITPLDIYLWQIADSIRTSASIATSVLTIFTLAAYTVGYIAQDDYPDLKTTMQRIRVALTGGLITSLLLCTLVPSSKTIAMMFVIPQIANSEIIQKDAPELFKSAIEAAKEALKTKP